MKNLWFTPMDKFPWFTKAAFSLYVGDQEGQIQSNTQSIQLHKITFMKYSKYFLTIRVK